jgi:glycosyltransferase involved in cell wall biosynthesis
MLQMGMGGSERLVHDLALRLDRSRFNPSVAWFSGDEVLQEFASLQVPLHHVPKTQRIDFSAMRALQRIVETNKIDIVNAQHFMPAVYSYYACKMAGRKALIFTAHSRWEVEAISPKWRLAGGYLLRRMDASIGVAPDVSSAIQSVFNTRTSQTVTIENGVDTEVFGQRNDVHGLKANLGLGVHDIVLGSVANLTKVKNHLFLIQAFARVAEQFDNVKLLLVGRGFTGAHDNTEDDLRHFVSDRRLADKVSFLGYRPDIPELLQVMDVFCLTSLREGLPLGLVEAMAAGLPVVGTNVEGIRDVVTQGEDGVLVELGDVTALKDALIGLVQDERWRDKLGRGGREKAVRKYSIQRCVGEYERLFLSVCQQGRGVSS